MKINIALIVVILSFVSSSLWAVTPTPTYETASAEDIKMMNEQLADVKETVEKDFKDKAPASKGDGLEVKRAVLFLTSENDNFQKIKNVQVYWKKCNLADQQNNRAPGYFLLVVNPKNQKAIFGKFYAGLDHLENFDFAASGLLKVTGESAECIDCEGGSWTQPYISFAAEKLLLTKPVTMNMN